MRWSAKGLTIDGLFNIKTVSYKGIFRRNQTERISQNLTLWSFIDLGSFRVGIYV